MINRNPIKYLFPFWGEAKQLHSRVLHYFAVFVWLAILIFSFHYFYRAGQSTKTVELERCVQSAHGLIQPDCATSAVGHPARNFFLALFMAVLIHYLLQLFYYRLVLLRFGLDPEQQT